jgi:4-hydroxy-3-polyprenylbenzoate decarboxylase
LEVLKTLKIDTHLVLSKSAHLTLSQETSYTSKDLEMLASVTYSIGDVGAAISSGSFQTMGMIIAPCSVKTLAEIASGVTPNLLSRAADVVLKERKRLVLGVRETPLHLGHIRNMERVTEMGGIIAPPVPAMYTKPSSLDDIVNHTIGRWLDLFDIEHALVKRWSGI